MKRFSLKSLLIATTAIAIFFGYGVVRRRAILEDCKVLRSLGVHFQLPQSWQDTIWQRRPQNMFVETTTKMPNDGLEDYPRMSAKLEKMGYYDVQYMIRVAPDK